MADHSDGQRDGQRDDAEERPQYAVLDLDATLADVRHRLHHIEARPKRWDDFFAEAVDDAPLDDGRMLATSLARAHRIVYLTGRPERNRAITTEWLRRYGFPDGELLLRGDTDRRPSAVYKLQQLRRLARTGTVAVLIDDDPGVCAAAEEAGFPVLRADWAPDVEAHDELHDEQRRGNT